MKPFSEEKNKPIDTELKHPEEIGWPEETGIPVNPVAELEERIKIAFREAKDAYDKLQGRVDELQSHVITMDKVLMAIKEVVKIA